MKPESAVDTALLWIWLSAVALAPVWFGANTPVIWGLHAVVLGLLLAFYGARSIQLSRPLAVSLRPLRVPLIDLAVVAAWAAVQDTTVVPSSWWNPVWAEASSALGIDIGGAVSVFPDAGAGAILWMATAAGVFFLAYQFGQRPWRAQLILYVVAIAGGANAAYGLIIYVSGNGWILWRPKQAYLDALTATFINKNTFAAYAGMILTVAFGLAFDTYGRQDQSRTSNCVCKSQFLLLGTVFVVVSIALVLAGSRAGTAVSLLGIGCVALLRSAHMRYSRIAVLGAFAASVLAIAGAVVLFGNVLVSRLAHFDRDFNGRLALDGSVFEAIKASPWLGYGLGTFEQAYPPFRAVGLQQSGRWEYAHNSWLESLMTLGVPAGVLLWLVFGWSLGHCLKGALRGGQEAIYPAIGAGVGVLAATQSLIDFPLQIQGFAIPFLAILGVAVAQSMPAGRGGRGLRE